MRLSSKQRKKPVRKVFGRVRVDAADWVYVFELTKAGLVVHRRNSRRAKDEHVPFDWLAAGNTLTEQVGGSSVRFALVPGAGLEVKVKGERTRVLPWEFLANYGRQQPVLFPHLESKK